MNVLIITQDTVKEIERIIKLAEDNVTPLNVVEKLANTKTSIEGLNKEFTIDIPHNAIVTYTHEEQRGGIICRHLSISTKIQNRVPSVNVVQTIMNLFRFINKHPKHAYYWFENCGNGQEAINVLEPLNGDMDLLKPDVVLNE